MPKFICEQGNPGNDNIRIDLNGLMLTYGANKQPWLTINFDQTKVLRRCSPFIQDGKLWVDTDVPESLLDSYPAIGYQVLKQHEEDGIKIIDEARLFQVSLCLEKNSDTSIKSIREQIASDQ